MSDQIDLSELFGFKQPEPPPPKTKSVLKHPASGSLSDARDWFQTALGEGSTVECPCCDRLASHRLVPIYNSDAHALMWLLRAWEAKGTQSWTHVPTEAERWLVNSRTFTKLQHWHLIEARPNEDSAKRTSGMWRPTDKGVAFAKGQITIPQHILMYNRKCLGTTGDPVYITDTFKEKFDYSKLMALNYSDLTRELSCLHSNDE